MLVLAIMLVLGWDCLADVNLLRANRAWFGGSPRIECHG